MRFVNVRTGQVIERDDPEAEGMAYVVEERNCGKWLALNRDRMEHFKERAKILGGDLVLVCLDVDDPIGGALAELLMPGHDWQAYRDRGERPAARGVVPRQPIIEILNELSPRWAKVLAERKSLAILVVSGGISIREA